MLQVYFLNHLSTDMKWHRDGKFEKGSILKLISQK